MIGLQGRIPNTSAGNWFQCYKRIFPYIYPLLPTPNFPFMIYPAQCGRSNLSQIGFHALSPEYTLKRAHMRDNFLCDTKVSQFRLFLWCADLAAFFCTLSDALICPSCTDPSTQPHIQELDVQVTCRLNFWYYYYPFLVFALLNVVLSRPFSPRS